MNTDRHARLARLLGERILVMDGAMGTELRRAAVTENAARGTRFGAHDVPLAGNLDLLTLTQPALVRAVHDAYLDAGADIIRANTFCGDSPSQAAYGLGALSYEINRTASRLARACADTTMTRTPDQPRFVAGVIGPSRGPIVASASEVGSGVGGGSRLGEEAAGHDDVPVQAADAYRAQVLGLIDGGVDLLLVETAVDTGNACAALTAIRSECAARRQTLPVMVSTTPATLRRHPGGARALVDICEAALGDAVLIFGLNCGDGSAGLADAAADVGQAAPWFASCHPSAGQPQPNGRYPESPDDFASAVARLARAGWLNVVGGCCGTTPDHIRALAAAIESVPPRHRGAFR